MVVLPKLKYLDAFNDLVNYSSSDDEHNSMVVEWSLVKGCASFFHLSISWVQKDVREWFNIFGRLIKELFVISDHSTYDSALDEFNALILPQLSTIFTRDPQVIKQWVASEWSETDSSKNLSDSIPDEARSNTDMPGSNLPEVDVSLMTVLDRLHEGGSQLSRLGLCINLRYDGQTSFMFLSYKLIMGGTILFTPPEPDSAETIIPSRQEVIVQVNMRSRIHHSDLMLRSRNTSYSAMLDSSSQSASLCNIFS